MGPLDRLWIWRARAACQIALLRRGGEELLQDACTEASWYADLHHPWDSTGCEPAARVNAWLSILAARVGVAAVSAVRSVPVTQSPTALVERTSQA